jgi:hypothetical protein
MTLPVAEELPRRECRPDLRASDCRWRAATKQFGDEQLRDGVAVVAKVRGVRVFDSLVGCLQLEEHEWDPVDEADDVTTALVHRADNPELAHGEELVVVGVPPVDRPYRLGDSGAVIGGERDLHAVTKDRPHRLVGPRRVHRRSICHDGVDRLLDRRVRKLRIQFDELRAEAMTEDDLRLVIAAEAAGSDVLGAELLGEPVDDLEAEVGQERERRLLDEGVFREPRRAHAASFGVSTPRSISEMSS